MTTKVEQLVMGAFWEAARKAYDIDDCGQLGKVKPEVYEERYAYHLAELIRTRGLESFDLRAEKGGLEARSNTVKHTANVSAETLDGIASMLERETSTMRTFVSRFRGDAARLRELAKDL